jgi:hypothetical protein
MKTPNPKPKLKTPILFLVFNRIDTTKQVFEKIKEARPKQLFIASDGPRKEKKGEKEVVEKVRKHVLDNIDWPCKVKTLFRKKNLGCKYAVSGAIDWFFKNVEQGIILEDDCLPSQSFFRFCEELLERYKSDERVMSISGYNPLDKFDVKESYLFSKYFYCWGWATWRRAWDKNDLEMKEYKKIKEEGRLKEDYPNFIERILREKRVNDCLNNKAKSWATSFGFSHQLNKGLCIVPRENLIENIGFSEEYSTNTKENKWDKKFLHRKSTEMKFPLKHPKKISSSKKFDKLHLKQDLKRVILKIVSNIWKR